MDLGHHLGDRNFDPEVVHLIAVVRADDVHKVFADVVDITFNGGQHQTTLRITALNFFHVRFEMCDSGLHCFCGLQHERQLHLA